MEVEKEHISKRESSMLCWRIIKYVQEILNMGMDHGGIQGSVMLSPRSSQLRAPRIAERLRLTQRSCQERIHFSFLVPISAMWLQSPKNQLNSFHKPKTVSLFELEIERRHILNGILYLSSAEHTVGV